MAAGGSEAWAVAGGDEAEPPNSPTAVMNPAKKTSSAAAAAIPPSTMATLRLTVMACTACGSRASRHTGPTAMPGCLRPVFAED
jgi:hypothetical protein